MCQAATADRSSSRRRTRPGPWLPGPSAPLEVVVHRQRNLYLHLFVLPLSAQPLTLDRHHSLSAAGGPLRRRAASVRGAFWLSGDWNNWRCCRRSCGPMKVMAAPKSPFSSQFGSVQEQIRVAGVDFIYTPASHWALRTGNACPRWHARWTAWWHFCQPIGVHTSPRSPAASACEVSLKSAV